MHSKRNSYSGHRRVEPEATINRRRERATQKAKQDDQIVEIAHESVSDKSQISIRETEERGCFWMLSRFCVMTIFTAMIALTVYMSFDGDLQSNQIWRDWRFIVPFLVFSSLIFLGLRDSRLRFLLVFPFTVLADLGVYMIWTSVSNDFPYVDISKFWRDWRFIIPLILFNSQAFLGLKEGWDSCLWNLFRFCFAFPIMVLPAFTVYHFSLFIIRGDSFEFRWDQYFTIFFLFVYYLTFLGIFGFLEKWITYLDRKIKRTTRKGANK